MANSVHPPRSDEANGGMSKINVQIYVPKVCLPQVCLPMKSFSSIATCAGSHWSAIGTNEGLNAEGPTGDVHIVPAFASQQAAKASTAPSVHIPVKRRRLGRFVYTGLPKPVPNNAARDAVSPAGVTTPDPIAGSSSRNAAPLQDVPPCPSACSSSSSQAKASPEVHTHEHAAANSIALPKSPPYSDGQLVQFGSFAPPARFTMSSNPLPAGSTTAPSSSSHSVTSGSEPHERSSRQVLSKRPVFALGPKLSKRFRAEGL